MSAENKARKSIPDVIGSVASTAVLFDGAMSRACRFISRFASACVILMAASQAVVAAGDVERGAKLFRNCLACHSIEAGRHLTGPSLANIWGRKAGTAEGFLRYSDALKSARVVWNEQTLDKWLKDSRDFIPGNEMSFPGIKEQQPRQDLSAFLKAVSEGKKALAGALAGGMTGNVKINLKNPDPRGEVKSLRHCGDTYFVTTSSGNSICASRRIRAILARRLGGLSSSARACKAIARPSCLPRPRKSAVLFARNVNDGSQCRLAAQEVAARSGGTRVQERSGAA